MPGDKIGEIFSYGHGAIVAFASEILRFGEDKRIEALKKENKNLREQLLDQTLLLQDLAALRDQFQITKPSSVFLLPARVVGMPSFIPGVSLPEQLTLDKGSYDGVLLGQAVVVGDNLLGEISAVSDSLSLVRLVYNAKTSFAGRILARGALGVVKGKGGGKMLLENVLLSEELTESDIVVTVGDSDEKANGFPSNLIVGKITSIEKKPSALFQTATIKSLIDFTKLTTVFVYKGIGK